MVLLKTAPVIVSLADVPAMTKKGMYILGGIKGYGGELGKYW